MMHRRKFVGALAGCFAILRSIAEAQPVAKVFHVGFLLGATGESVASLFHALKEGLRMPLIGMGIGLVAAGLLTRFMTHLLFETSARDPVTYSAIMLVLAGAAAAACFLPARRASRVDPMVALRQE